MKVNGSMLPAVVRASRSIGAILMDAGLLTADDAERILLYQRDKEVRFGEAAITLGLTRFVTEVVAPLNVMVGEAWMRGALEVFEEHLYTESVTTIIRNTIGNVPEQGEHSTPKVLLTTFPQEAHALGLLMAQSLMAVEGCRCVSLGTQTPMRDIVLAAPGSLPNDGKVIEDLRKYG